MRNGCVKALALYVCVLPACAVAGSMPVELQWSEIPTPVTERARFRVSMPDGIGASRELVFSNETTKIHSAKLVDNMVVVIGSVGTAADIVSVYDSRTHDVDRGGHCI